jgi:proteasome lid subunit RPN8/RPN11
VADEENIGIATGAAKPGQVIVVQIGIAPLARLVDEVLAHAALTASVDEECCGIAVRSSGGVWVATWPMSNVAHDKAHAYALDPAEQLRYWQQVYNAGHKVGAIYHSHNHGAPFPSTLDMAQWPDLPRDMEMWIAHAGVLTSWRISADKAHIRGQVLSRA